MCGASLQIFFILSTAHLLVSAKHIPKTQDVYYYYEDSTGGTGKLQKILLKGVDKFGAFINGMEKMLRELLPDDKPNLFDIVGNPTQQYHTLDPSELENLPHIHPHSPLQEIVYPKKVHDPEVKSNIIKDLLVKLGLKKLIHSHKLGYLPAAPHIHHEQPDYIKDLIAHLPVENLVQPQIFDHLPLASPVIPYERPDHLIALLGQLSGGDVRPSAPAVDTHYEPGYHPLLQPKPGPLLASDLIQVPEEALPKALINFVRSPKFLSKALYS